jgi:hypothetical protein
VDSDIKELIKLLMSMVGDSCEAFELFREAFPEITPK